MTTCPVNKSQWVNTHRVNRNPFGIARRIIVHVLQKHIDMAVANCPSACAVALALLDMGYTNVRVALNGDGALSFTTKNGKERWRYQRLPEKVIMATHAVDNGNKHKLTPFTFITEFGHKHAVEPWKRLRDAGGPRRGKRLVPRIDKGLPQGRTARRDKLAAAIHAAA